MDIIRRDGKGRGHYTVRVGTTVATMTFLRPDPGLMIIDHTMTPTVLAGQGIAGRLVERAVADARAEGFRIRPVCSYVVRKFDTRPDWADIRAEDP